MQLQQQRALAFHSTQRQNRATNENIILKSVTHRNSSCRLSLSFFYWFTFWSHSIYDWERAFDDWLSILWVNLFLFFFCIWFKNFFYNRFVTDDKYYIWEWEINKNRTTTMNDKKYQVLDLESAQQTSPASQKKTSSSIFILK